MKIAFFLTGYRLSYGNGIVSQAKTWKRGLESLGHKVILCSNWDYVQLETCDAIQIFGFNESIADYVHSFRMKNNNIFIAPIFDPDYSVFNTKLRAHYGNVKLRLYNRFQVLHSIRNDVRGVMVRSEFEKKYMVHGFGFNPTICRIVKLPSGITPLSPLPQKEPFCLHISLLADDRKNVRRLIEASSKYNFHLILAGTLRNEQEKTKFSSWIQGKNNVEYLGWVTEEEKIDLYKRAKVFALPSINEGVGIVALEAACYGADIVITNIGGPKEYYNNLAIEVNPYDIDSIGKAVKSFLNGQTFQPQLAQYIDKNYSLTTTAKLLEQIYSGL